MMSVAALPNPPASVAETALHPLGVCANGPYLAERQTLDGRQLRPSLDHWTQQLVAVVVNAPAEEELPISRSQDRHWSDPAESSVLIRGNDLARRKRLLEESVFQDSAWHHFGEKVTANKLNSEGVLESGVHVVWYALHHSAATTSTGFLVRTPVVFNAAWVASQRTTFSSAYTARLRELMEIAIDEGIAPDAESRRQFQRFVEVSGARRADGLFLLDDGRYAATWRDKDWRFDLEFAADGGVDYVLLNLHSDVGGQAETVDLGALLALVHERGLESLLQDEG